jgi:quercetin dioxygenase-like cupin family protein
MRPLTTVAIGLALLTTVLHAQGIDISRHGSRPPVTGASETFTGRVSVQPLFAATEHSKATGGQVTFSPGARTAWHTHPAGQTLIVTAGTGWVQAWNGRKQEIQPGDVVWTPPGVKHWHGATASNDMTHIAIQENVAGKNVEWMEHVTDAQYSSTGANDD